MADIEICRPEGHKTLARLAATSGLMPIPDFLSAFVAGAANKLGENAMTDTAARRPDFCGFWAEALGAAPTAECISSFRRGMVEGEALYVMDLFRVVHVRVNPQRSSFGFHGLIDDWPAICETLLRWGVTVKTLDAESRVYELLIGP